MLQKADKTNKNIFASAAKPYGNKVLSFHVLDILLSAKHPLTVFEIRKEIASRKGYVYSFPAIHSCINCVNDMDCIQLNITTVRRGQSKPKAFTIQIKTNNNESETIA